MAGIEPAAVSSKVGPAPKRQEESSSSSGPDDFKTAFRLAQCLGLFPVKGLTHKKSGRDSGIIAFKPLSLRLFATVALLLVILVIEGIGLFHIFVLGSKKEEFQVSKEGFIVQQKESPPTALFSLAPIVHYGTTVWF